MNCSGIPHHIAAHRQTLWSLSTFTRRCKPSPHRSSTAMQANLEGKTFLVTGSTDGIGRHTATKLASAGANVIIHGRNPTRVADTTAALRKYGKGDISAYTCELGSLAQIRQLASDIKKDMGGTYIDVLINNAGVFLEEYLESEDGYEMTWAVNVVAPFLLTHLLLPVVSERIVNVASISASSSIDFDNLQQEKGFSAHDAYGLSKLASQIYTQGLARRLDGGQLSGADGARLKTACLDPGTVNTKMLLAGWGPCGIQVKDANDEYWLATANDNAIEQGAYYVGGRLSRLRRPATDKAVQDKLWDILEVQTGVSGL